LQKNKIYKAYLNKKDNYYIPAASGQSFKELKMGQSPK